jgi:colicin import membrane protein
MMAVDRLTGRQPVAALRIAATVLAATLGAGGHASDGWPEAAAGQPEAARPVPAVAAPTRVDPDGVLPGIEERGPLDEASARTLRAAVLERRPELRDGLVRERAACFRTFLVNRCVADVDARTRQINARLDALEVRANQALRQQAAVEHSTREAETLAAALATLPADEARRAENQAAFERRADAVREAQAQRERDRAALEERERINRAERQRREQAAAQRQAADRPARPR